MKTFGCDILILNKLWKGNKYMKVKPRDLTSESKRSAVYMRNLTAILFTAALLLAFLAGCAGNAGTENGITSAQASETIDNTSSAETQSGDEGSSASDKVPDGTLLYFEDFEKYKNLSNTEIANRIGWKELGVEDGAYYDITAELSIKDFGSNKKLYVQNNFDGAKDSYVQILSAKQIGCFTEGSYTLQYDLEYADANASDRYITIVTDYASGYYNSFHLRNNGRANHECHLSGAWYPLDIPGSCTASGDEADAENTVAYKLLGAEFDSKIQLLSGLSVTIRYVTDRENGNSVYMRVNDTEGGSGEWVLVSRYSDASEAALLDSALRGYGITLKVGGRQNGYIDNIMIWSGTAESPIEGGKALIRSNHRECYAHSWKEATCTEPITCRFCGLTEGEARGHSFTGENESSVCGRCGLYEVALTENWLLGDVPVYNGGKKSAGVYNSGQGIADITFSPSNDGYMQIISQTSAAEFGDYQNKLESFGYIKDYANERDGNIYAGFIKDGKRIYTYYTASSETVRVIVDTSSSASVSDFGYVYEKSEGDNTVVYQYGLPMSVSGFGIDINGENLVDNGMMHMMRLGDGKLLLIDGGSFRQFDDAQIDGMMEFIENNFKREADGKFHIAAWFITHCHSDHMSGAALFFKKYSEQFVLERFICNFPSPNSGDVLFSAQGSAYKKLINYINKYLPGASFLKLHSGQAVQLADVTLNVLYTHEDLVNAEDCISEVDGDYNNTSTVLRIDFDGKRYLVLGDTNRASMKRILEINSDETLRADILQGAHHMKNDIRELYAKVRAQALLLPSSAGGAYRSDTRKKVMELLLSYVRDDMYYYASDGTAGLAVADGEVKLVFTDVIHGGIYTDWSW